MVDLYTDEQEAERLSPDSRFHFSCHPGLACFNQCCRNPTIILKPYDIILLRRRLGITSTEFLERYTIKVIEEKSFLPLVMLDIDPDAGSGCPFLGAAGCSVYEDRPGACRLFPVIQGSTMGREGLEDAYFCKHLVFCQGFAAGAEWTLSRWKADQGMQPHDDLSKEWLEIILKRGAMDPPADDARAQTLFFMAACDIDKFRRFVFETPFLQTFEIPPNVTEVLRKSDVDLLQFGYKYLKMVLLIEDAGQMKEEMKLMPQPPDQST